MKIHQLRTMLNSLMEMLKVILHETNNIEGDVLLNTLNAFSRNFDRLMARTLAGLEEDSDEAIETVDTGNTNEVAVMEGSNPVAIPSNNPSPAFGPTTKASDRMVANPPSPIKARGRIRSGSMVNPCSPFIARSMVNPSSPFIPRGRKRSGTMVDKASLFIAPKSVLSGNASANTSPRMAKSMTTVNMTAQPSTPPGSMVVKFSNTPPTGTPFNTPKKDPPVGFMVPKKRARDNAATHSDSKGNVFNSKPSPTYMAPAPPQRPDSLCERSIAHEIMNAASENPQNTYYLFPNTTPMKKKPGEKENAEGKEASEHEEELASDPDDPMEQDPAAPNLLEFYFAQAEAERAKLPKKPHW